MAKVAGILPPERGIRTGVPLPSDGGSAVDYSGGAVRTGTATGRTLKISWLEWGRVAFNRIFFQSKWLKTGIPAFPPPLLFQIRLKYSVQL